MSFNTLSEQNKELVAKLYGLKAGLSLISIEVDRLREAENKKVELEKNEEKCIHNVSAYKEAVSSYARVVDESREAVDGDGAVRSKKIVAGCVYIVIGVIVAIVLAVGAMSCAASGDTAMVLPMLGLGAAAVIIGVGIALYKIIPALKDSRAKLHRDKLEQNLAYLNQRKAELEQAEAELKTLTDGKARCISEYESAVKESLERAMFLYRSVLETYGDILDEGDWGSIDYLIFVYVSGRAEDMPTALRCLDEERRYLGIVAAINKASAEVTATIDQAFTSLSMQLSQQFASLENNINRNMSSMTSAIKGLGSEISKNTDAVNNVGVGITAQNALLSKSNATTKQLADDLNYIVTRVRAGQN